MKRLLVALLWSGLALQAQAQALWRELPSGATPDEVQRLLPNAAPPAEVMTLNDGVTKSLLEYRGFELAELPFRALMFFRNDKLDRVFLMPEHPREEVKVPVVAYHLRNGLMAKYGPAAKEHKTQAGPSTIRQTEWTVRGTLIVLLDIQHEDQRGGLVQVNYFAPQGTNNL